MKTATVTPVKTVKTPPVPEAEPSTETFQFHLADGSLGVCGKPQGVLKMRLRYIISESLRKDPEIEAIAKAFLCIKTINGRPPVLSTEKEFDGLLNRFGSDAAIDEFMAKYQELTNPGVSKILKEVLEQAVKEKWTQDEIQEAIQEGVLKLELEKRNLVQD